MFRWPCSCVSGIFVAHHQKVYWMANRQSTEKHNTYQLLYIYCIPLDDGLQMCPKHVEADWRNILRINSASSWFSLNGYNKEVPHSKNIHIDWDFWRNKDPVFIEDALIWFTDRSRANSGTGSGIFGLRPNRSFPLGKFATVFQTEVHAILQCARENIRRAYKHKRILIFSDSQAALKALRSPKVTSALVAECLDTLCAGMPEWRYPRLGAGAPGCTWQWGSWQAC
jgi:hypothetical protein